jgi:hypothetical protein
VNQVVYDLFRPVLRFRFRLGLGRWREFFRLGFVFWDVEVHFIFLLEFAPRSLPGKDINESHVKFRSTCTVAIHAGTLASHDSVNSRFSEAEDMNFSLEIHVSCKVLQGSLTKFIFTRHVHYLFSNPE